MDESILEWSNSVWVLVNPEEEKLVLMSSKK